MLHANAALTPAQRLKLARLIVEEGWPTAWAAKFFTVSWKTADRWARRDRAKGKAGMTDRSSRLNRPGFSGGLVLPGGPR